MNLNDPDLYLPEESFRWFGPPDPVSLYDIRQAGAESVFTSLHQIPYGEAWSKEAIAERKSLIEAAGLKWTAVESVPVAEGIKTGRGDLPALFENYRQTLRNLAEEGITTVIYNFMPVLDWVRTDIRHVLPDGSECLRFDPVHFAAFEIHALHRAGAEDDYSSETRAKAAEWWNRLDDAQQARFVQSIIDVFPGMRLDLTLDDIRALLARYEGIDAEALRANFAHFLKEVVPTAQEAGIRMAVHPDDPPYPLLGLPRIVSTAQDVETIFGMVDQQANGLCFCTGSFSVRADNDLPEMFRRFGSRVHALHLRSTHREPEGGFYEADHLRGSVDMPAIASAVLGEQDRRREEGRQDWRLPLRPDHGHTIMDDLAKPPPPNPGYSGIGRMRGLAELRGLMLGLRYSQRTPQNKRFTEELRS